MALRNRPRRILLISVLQLLVLIVLCNCAKQRQNGQSMGVFMRYRPSGDEMQSSHQSSSTSTKKTYWSVRRKNLPNERRNLKRPHKAPNIIFILTDDQDVELNSMQYMPKTRRILVEGGVEAERAYVTTPMCCPSRSSILTGLYAHNHNVYTNGENCSSPAWQRTHERRTFATYLSEAGYRTAYFGKYLNEYNGSYVPPGWADWSGLVRNSRYYNYTLNVNGERVRHGADYATDYYPDLIVNDTLQYLRYSRRFFPAKPYLLVMSFPSPHGTEDAAPQFQNLFWGEKTHRTASWNVAPNGDKQWILRHTGPMSPLQQHFTDFLHMRRLQTLQSVDDAVERLYHELRLLGELEHTYIVYTSDNGFHLGQFGLVKGKAMPFEFDVRVPFFVRGPGLAAGAKLKDIVLNIDIAPTFLDIAGIETPAHMDGTSFLPALRKLSAEESNSASVVRTVDQRRSSEENFVPRDSFLIEKGKFKFPSKSKEPNGLSSKKQWLQAECQKPEYKSPCEAFQRFECYVDLEGTYRIRKCRRQDWKRRFAGSKRKICVCPSTTLNHSSTFDSNDIRRLGQRRIRREDSADTSVRNSDPVFEFLTSIFVDETPFDTAGVFELKRLIDLAKNQSESNQSPVLKETVFEEKKKPKMTFSKNELNAEIKELRRRLAELKELRRFMKTQTAFSGLNSPFCDCANPNSILVSSSEPVRTQHRRIGQQRYLRPSVALINRRLLKQLDRKKWLRKQERKLKRKGKFENTTCHNSEQMNCFFHDNDHWKTPPLWNEGSFCFCQNALNNSFWCMRTINASHNSLYCEFVTGFMLYFDMITDPFQLRNAIYDLEFSTLERLSLDLAHLKSCAGHRNCLLPRNSRNSEISSLKVSKTRPETISAKVARSGTQLRVAVK